MNTIWVVEMRIGSKWFPTVGARLNREDGRKELHAWKLVNAGCDGFRLTKYSAPKEMK